MMKVCEHDNVNNGNTGFRPLKKKLEMIEKNSITLTVLSLKSKLPKHQPKSRKN